MELDYIETPGYTLSYSRTNFQNNTEFYTDTWPVAVANFIKFLRGAGYVIPEDKILIKDGELVVVPAEIYAQDYE